MVKDGKAKRSRYLVIALLILLILIAVIYFIYLVNFLPKEGACTQSDGEWRQFPDSCANTCPYERGSDMYCAEVLTYSCDCGPAKCWDGRACVSI